MPKSTHWCFTSQSKLWNKDTGLDPLSGAEVPPIIPTNDAMIWLSYSLELGATTRRYHLQGWCVYRTPRSMKQVTKDLPAGVHLEIQVGQNKHNVVYVSKEHTHIRGPWNFGDINSVPENPKVKVPAYEGMRDLVKAGASKKDIYDKFPFFLGKVSAIDEAMKYYSPNLTKSRPVKVYLVWGEPHSGKTEAAQHAFPNHFLVVSANTLNSFAGYTGQDTVIFDAFKPNEWPITVLEQFIKPPVVSVNVKYGSIQTLWTTVIFTTNCHPDSLYCGDVSRDSLFRRITKIIHVDYTAEEPAAIKVLDFS